MAQLWSRIWVSCWCNSWSRRTRSSRNRCTCWDCWANLDFLNKVSKFNRLKMSWILQVGSLCHQEWLQQTLLHTVRRRGPISQRPKASRRARATSTGRPSDPFNNGLAELGTDRTLCLTDQARARALLQLYIGSSGIRHRSWRSTTTQSSRRSRHGHPAGDSPSRSR